MATPSISTRTARFHPPIGVALASGDKGPSDLNRGVLPKPGFALAHLSTRGPLLTERPTSQGGIRSLSTSLRSAGCYSPLDPLLLHSWPAPHGASHEPWGFAPCPLRFAQRAATPPWTLCFSTRGPLLTERPTSQADSHLVPFASLSGLLLPPG